MHTTIARALGLFMLATTAAALSACAGDADDAAAMESAAATSAKPVTSVLVSDIDDTIKRTGVHSSRVVVNALSTTKEFAGMSMLYTGWHSLDARSKKITYLSAAPGPAINLGIDFLRGSRFPGDTADVSSSVVGGRGLESAGEFKGKRLIAMYDASVTKPETMILVGDNGEQDMAAYSALIDHVKSTRGTTRVYSFIHHVYESAGKSTPITSPHVPWLTAADLAVRFHEARLIDTAALTNVLNEVAYDSAPLGDLTDAVVPSFMECGHFVSWPKLEPTLGASTLKTYESVQTNVKTLCR